MKKSRKRINGVEVSRRQALGMMTAACAVATTFDPVKTLIQGLVDGLLNKAQAGGAAPRNYLYIAFPSGPCRWHWDLPLCPYSGLNNPNYVYPTASLNPGLVNKFKNASGIDMEYGTVVVTAPQSGVRLRMPYLWSLNIPTAGGGWAPMVNLLDNMAFLRGIESLDGHGDSQLIQLRPKPGAPSVDGAVTDQSTRAIPSLALLEAPNVYMSGKGIGNVRVTDVSNSGTGPLGRILAPFDRASFDNYGSGYLSRRDAMEAAMSQAMETLGAAARARNPGAETLWASRSTAENYLKRGLGDVSTAYTTLYNKYSDLVARCAREHALSLTPFIADRPLVWSQLPSPLIQGMGSYVSSLQGSYGYDNTTGPITSLRGLAESFAIAEYLFVNGYTSAITASCSAIDGLKVSGYTPYGWDEHGSGALVSMVNNAFLFRGVAACLYEFTNVLKQHGIFEETVIHLGGEFSRSPRNDQRGSDHSPNGNAISLISGSIRRPFVIGDTQPSAGDPDHAANFGIGKPIQLDGGIRQPTAGNQASTIAHLLRVKSPSPNDASMLYDSASGIVATVELARQEEES
jgi:hypothetical protein